MPTPKPDFVVQITAGQLMPTGSTNQVTIQSNGLCTGEHQPRRDKAKVVRRKYYLGQAGVAKVSVLVDSTNLWSATSSNAGFVDGDYVRIELKQGARALTVVKVNSAEPAMEEFVDKINQLLPDELQIHYNHLDLPGLGEVSL